MFLNPKATVITSNEASATPAATTTYEAEAAANTLAGGATVYPGPNNSGGQRVGSIGTTGTLQFNNVNVSATGSTGRSAV